jgi:hypothetical protein
VRTKGPVVFVSAAGKAGIAKAAGLGVRWIKDNGDGFATYEIDFAAKQHTKPRR